MFISAFPSFKIYYIDHTWLASCFILLRERLFFFSSDTLIRRFTNRFVNLSRRFFEIKIRFSWRHLIFIIYSILLKCFKMIHVAIIWCPLKGYLTESKKRRYKKNKCFINGDWYEHDVIIYDWPWFCYENIQESKFENIME